MNRVPKLPTQLHEGQGELHLKGDPQVFLVQLALQPVSGAWLTAQLVIAVGQQVVTTQQLIL